MGNAQTIDGNKQSLAKIVDFIATNYILTQNFQDMKKLSDMKYCNNLVILTSKVIENKLSDIEIEFLAQRLKQGNEVNEMTKEDLKFMNKNDLPNLDVKNQTQKRRMCIGIAKFYVKIAHIYAAIVTTIKPNYTYTEERKPVMEMKKPLDMQKPAMIEQMNKVDPNRVDPNRVDPNRVVPIEQKQSIPTDAKVAIKINNLCSQRLNALLNGQDMSGENIVVKPNFCKMNLDISTNKSRNLASEPGIPELSKLYYDKYDFDQGGFTGMTEDMKKVYLADVKKFYTIFTGNSTVPPEIKTFSDIPLRSYQTSNGCKPGGVYLNEYKGNVKDRLFKTYADHVKKMMATTEENQNKLLDQIDKLFVFNANPITNEREVTINSHVTDIELQKIVEETRKIIIDLYITCETDFLTGLEIFEAIVEKQIMDTSQVQMSELQRIIDNKLSNSDLSELRPNEYKPNVNENEKPSVSLFDKIVTPIESFAAPIKQTFIADKPMLDKPMLDKPMLAPTEKKDPVAIASQVSASQVPATLPSCAPQVPVPVAPVPVAPVPVAPVPITSVPISTTIKM
jgi:hypothetical protein